MPDLILFDKNHAKKRLSYLNKESETSWQRCGVCHGKRCLHVQMVTVENLEGGPSAPQKGFLIGEWEGKTEILRVEENGRRHISYAPVATSPSDEEWQENFSAACQNKRHNTDPLYLGERFYYANCLQYAEGCDYLREVPDRSLILFGEHAEKNSTLFQIECVFHVKNSVSYSPQSLVAEVRGALITGQMTVTYQAETLEKYFVTSSTLPLHFYDNTLQKRKYQLYFGSGYVPGTNHPYSFFPCKNGPFIAQPFIDLTCYGLTTKRMYAATRYAFPESTLKAYWRRFAKSIIEQGFALGIRADFL